MTVQRIRQASAGSWSWWMVALLVASLWGGRPTSAQTPRSDRRVAKTKKQDKGRLQKVSWALLKRSLDAGMSFARALLVRQAKQPLTSVSARSRVQWNANSIARFAQAYQHYHKDLAQALPGQKAIWRAWKQQLVQLAAAAKQLRQSALNGKPTAELQAAIAKLSTWKALPWGNPPKQWKGTRQQTVLTAISGLSTGLEFAGYYRLRRIALELSTKPTNLDALRAFLGRIRAYRSAFRVLKTLLPKSSWAPLFVYHSELFYRAAVYLGRASASAGKKKQTFTSRWKRYRSMLKASLVKSNPSFPKFWRPAPAKRKK